MTSNTEFDSANLDQTCFDTTQARNILRSISNLSNVSSMRGFGITEPAYLAALGPGFRFGITSLGHSYRPARPPCSRICAFGRTNVFLPAFQPARGEATVRIALRWSAASRTTISAAPPTERPCSARMMAAARLPTISNTWSISSSPRPLEVPERICRHLNELRAVVDEGQGLRPILPRSPRLRKGLTRHLPLAGHLVSGAEKFHQVTGWLGQRAAG